MSDNNRGHPKVVCADCVVLHTSKGPREGVCSQELLPGAAPWAGFAVQLSGPCTLMLSSAGDTGLVPSQSVLWMVLLPDCLVTFPQGQGGESSWMCVEVTHQSWGCSEHPLPVLSHLLARAEHAGSLPRAEKMRSPGSAQNPKLCVAPKLCLQS